MDLLNNITKPFVENGRSYYYEPTKRDKIAFALMNLILFIANKDFRTMLTDVNQKYLGSYLFKRKLSVVPLPDTSDIPFNMENY